MHDIVEDRAQILSRSAAACLVALQYVSSGPSRSTVERVKAVGRLIRATLRGESSDSIRSLMRDGGDITTLESLFERRWVMSDRQLLDRLTAAGTSGATPVTCVAVVTKDRVPLLRRCLISLLENRRRWGRTYRLAVFDDSGGAATRAETRTEIARLAAAYDAPIRYVDLDAKRQFIESVAARSGLDKQVLEFGFLGARGEGPSYGANLNNFLLHVGGEVALCVDDDVVCRLAAAPAAKTDRLHFSDEADPTEFRFFPSRQQAFAAVRASDGDLAAVHERALGKSLGALAASFAQNRVSSISSQRLLRSVLLGRGTVVTTWMGLVGDHALGAPHNVLLLKVGCLARLYDELQRDGNSVTRDVVRFSPEMTITSGGSFMNTVFGADQRTLLPPFMPTRRNCDGLFSVCVPLCHPHGYFAHVPFVVAHDPVEDRRWCRDDLWKNAATLRVNDLIALVLRNAEHAIRGGDDVDARTIGLGLYCETVGKQPFSSFKDAMRAHFVEVQHARLGRLAERLNGRSASHRRWAPDIRRQVVLIRDAINARDFAPCDLQGSPHSPEDALRQTQRAFREFGQLLMAWPTICLEGASLLKAHGSSRSES